MRASRCLFNPATALCKLFISNATALENPGHLQRLLLPSRTVPIRPSYSSPSRRHFSVYHAAQLNYRRKPAKYGKDEPEKSNTMSDYNIAFPWIQLRQEDGRLSEPQRTNLVLKRLNMSLDTLILVAAPKLDDLESGPKYPICRIGNRQAERAAELERLAMKKNAPKIVTKELEINWAIAPNDLRTRMTQLQNFLTKGRQVRVTLRHPKLRRKKRATLDQAKVILKEVESAAAEVPGTKETKPREGVVGEMLVLLLHAPTKTAKASTETASASVSDPAATEATPTGEEIPAEKETPAEEETAAEEEAIPSPVAEEPGPMKE